MAGSSSDVRSQSKKIVFSVYNNLKELVHSKPGATINEVFNKTQEMTASLCSLSLRTVQRICQEGNKNVPFTGECSKELFKSPKKKIPHKKWITGLDDFNKDVVRRSIQAFYDRGEYPSCSKVREILKENIGFTGSVKSTWRILKSIGFRYQKCNDGRKFLMERTDIVVARVKFLRKMHEVRQENLRPVIYLDETWVNQNHSRKYIWQTSTSSGGLKVPVGKGSRIIVCHAGSFELGFIKGCDLIFQSKRTGDYHQDMNSDVFREWFINLLRSLDQGCIIVMDNASYHSSLKEKVPTTNTKKEEIVSWLKEKELPCNPTHTIRELLSVVNEHRNKYRRYELDDIAAEMGHEVVRLPPYHCQYNPIELIWAQIKGEVATKNNTFKINDVKKLLEEAIKKVTVDDWQKCVRHAENLQEADFIKEGLRDENLQRMVVNLRDDDSSDENSTDSSSDEEL